VIGQDVTDDFPDGLVADDTAHAALDQVCDSLGIVIGVEAFDFSDCVPKRLHAGSPG
jgi:hypothetical protein